MNRVLASIAVTLAAVGSTATVAQVVTSSELSLTKPVKQVLCRVVLLNQSS